MSQLFTRAQERNISLEAMQEYKSIHGWDDETGEYLRVDGLACCNGLAGSMGFGNADTRDGVAEIVVFEGQWIENIYDGCVAQPTKIVARFVPSEYKELAESGRLYEMFDGYQY